MTIKIYLVLVSIIISASLCGQTEKSKFTISGQVQGFSNGTFIYLNDVSDGYYKKLDSALIKDQKFVITGYLKTKYLKASITSFDNDDRATFWLENGFTSFKAEKGNFTKARIIGSPIQKKWSEYICLLDTAKNAEQAEFMFIKANPNSIISAYALSYKLKNWSKDTLSTLYKVFSKNVKQTDFGEKINNYISLNRNIKIGDKFVDFSQKDTANKIVKLSDFKNKIVLLEFWGSWCGPCREENPGLVKIHNEFRLKGFDILGVASETDKSLWIKAIKADGLTWTNISDLKGGNNKAAIIYGVTGYPTNFLIDKAGTIIAQDVYGEDLRNWLLKKL